MSDTPRTDAESFYVRQKDFDKCEVVTASTAREMERELATVTEQRDVVTQSLRDYDYDRHVIRAERDQLKQQLAECRAVLSAGKVALESVYNNGWGSEVFPAQPNDHPGCSWCVRFDAVWNALILANRTLDGPASSDTDHTGTGSLPPRRDGTGCRESQEGQP